MLFFAKSAGRGWSAVVGLLLGTGGAATAQTPPPNAPARHIVLADVTVRGRRPQAVGTYHGAYIRGVRPLTPGQRCVVWLASPDTSQTFGLQALTVPLHRRYTAGRLQISFYARGAGPELLGPLLSAQPVVVAPPDSIARRRTQVRLDLRPAALPLPAAGVYVVLECLPTFPDETYLRRVAVPRRAKKDGSTIVKPYILTRRGTDTTTIWTSVDDFPKLRQSPAGYTASTWMRWGPTLPYRRESAQSFRGKAVQAFDTVLLLELQPR
ncbi:hypothetical protein [Hymenobacter edaphi]|uniref:hypothetical protein n=1 Tax=Hymenobacter edaphi TaxID=2211146 RepID=UPI0010580142|nr:hypothetical protein [Hymenobacter edaphi]